MDIKGILGRLLSSFNSLLPPALSCSKITFSAVSSITLLITYFKKKKIELSFLMAYPAALLLVMPHHNAVILFQVATFYHSYRNSKLYCFHIWMINVWHYWIFVSAACDMLSALIIIFALVTLIPSYRDSIMLERMSYNLVQFPLLLSSHKY